MPWCFGLSGIGAHQQKAPIGEMRARGPHFLTVDQEMVALVDRAGAQAGEVGAGARLGIALAPDLVAGQDFRQIALFLFLAAPVDQRRAEQVHADRAGQDRRAGAEILLVEDNLLHEAGAAPAIVLRPGDADPAGRMHLLLPGAAALQRLAIGRDTLVLRILDLEVVGQVGFEPGAELAAEGGVFWSVGEVHFVLLLLLRRIAADPGRLNRAVGASASGRQDCRRRTRSCAPQRNPL